MCVDILELNSEQIWGPGQIIKIDESKFGKGKYHRGKRVEGVWVLKVLRDPQNDASCSM